MLCGAFSSSAQYSVRDSSISMVLIAPSYALQVPSGDLAKRFGVNSSVGLSVTYKHKSKWMFSAEGFFIFGGKVKEPDLLKGISTEQGFIIGNDGRYANLNITERGYCATLSAGRLFPVGKPNPNCGIFVQAGVGFIQHRIRIDDKKNSSPSILDEYQKGYDHLTNGLLLREFAGYMYTGNRRLVNFFFGAEMMQGFTAGRRTYNFDTGKAENPQRVDLLFGLRAGWILPLYKQAPEKFYTY